MFATICYFLAIPLRYFNAESATVDWIMKMDQPPRVPKAGKTLTYVAWVHAPWGEPIPMYFSEEEFSIVESLAEMSNTTVEEVIVDVAKSRLGIQTEE